MNNVRLSCKALSEKRIEGRFDLIVLSEICYYFEVADLCRIASNMMACLLPGGIIVAAHWLGSSCDHVLSGDAVHNLLHSIFEPNGMVLEQSGSYPEFRLDRWTKTPQAVNQKGKP
jgi:hypothetical protein